MKRGKFLKRFRNRAQRTFNQIKIHPIFHFLIECPELDQKMKYWMYLDLVECPLGSVPEPLQEFATLHLGDTENSLMSHRILRLSVDRLRGYARIHLGSWLSFDDTKS